MTETVVYVRSAFSRTHLAVEHAGRIRTACEAADLDPATREIIWSLAEVDSSELCARCFPHVTVQGQEASVTS